MSALQTWIASQPEKARAESKIERWMRQNPTIKDDVLVELREGRVSFSVVFRYLTDMPEFPIKSRNTVSEWLKAQGIDVSR